MNFWRDPFAALYSIYGLILTLALALLISISLLIEDWYLEEAALPLLGTELSNLEDIHYEEGPRSLIRWIRNNRDDLFIYIYQHRGQRFKNFQGAFPAITLSEKQVGLGDGINFTLNGKNYIGFWVPIDEPESEYIDSDTEELYDAEVPSELFPTLYEQSRLAEEESILLAVNTEHLLKQAQSVTRLGVLLMLFLIVGLLFIGLFVRRITTRLKDINQTCATIISNRTLDQRIPEKNITGPLRHTTDQLNTLLSHMEDSVLKSRRQAANIAHDLRTPLTGVYNQIQEQARHYPALASSEQILQRLLSTFNLLLRINQLEGQASFQKQPVEISQTIQDAIELYEPVLESRNQSIIYHSAAHFAHANEDLLQQSLCNLLDNASKYSPENSDIEINISNLADKLIIEVNDNGPGVPQASIQYLSDRFYRLDTSRQESQGNGLGLSFVKAAVEAMQGKLEISNRKHTPGLTVTLTLNATGSHK
ncbi:sensor histidine kinase [Aliamphritea ceti]|uniref:sensor histidine kinase n=1 Tax=Aliamphritea ceti TaxID=1524258 RepID=UPI0021C44745|nr:HAMP domain-containing sensor histidine kinase [Aliamphritea ceti]